MKHRDRVECSLSHEKPDRCPMQISFTPEFAERLRAELGLPQGSMHNPHGGGNTYILERKLDEDCLLTSVGWANSYYGGDDYTDEWGVGWSSTEYSTPFGKGSYTEIVHHPLADDAAVAGYRPPVPQRRELYTEAERVIQEYKSEYWIVGVTVTTIFETAWGLRGLEQLLMDFVLDPPLAETILDFPFRYHLEAAKRLAELEVDMLWLGDDMGTQQGMLVSPELWRQFFKPRMAEFISTVRSINKNIKIAYHSDGNIMPIVPELIEIGVDVLNPIQPACMDPAEVKRRFGKELCFWGTIDEQYTLPFGTPEQVKEEVKLRLETAGKDGGLIIGPTHHIQLDTPMENLWALVDGVQNS